MAMVPTFHVYLHLANPREFAQQWGMPVTIKVDATKAIEGLHALQRNQIPYALARTLTASAKDAQKAVQETLPRTFTLRNRFTQQGIRIKPADKNGERIEADVHTYTANQKSGVPGYMERQEDGGEKVPVGGHQHLAIPTRYLRKYASGAIPEEFRPRSLLPPDAEEGVAYKGMMGRVVGGGRKRLTQRASKALRQGYTAFIRREAGSGTLCLFVRLAGSRDIEPWYILITTARVKPRLEMHAIVSRTVQATFPKNWQNTWNGDRGIMTQGLRVRF